MFIKKQKTIKHLNKSRNFTIHECVCNVIAVQNPTQYTKNDKPEVSQKSSLVRNLTEVGHCLWAPSWEWLLAPHGISDLYWPAPAPSSSRPRHSFHPATCKPHTHQPAQTGSHRGRAQGGHHIFSPRGAPQWNRQGIIIAL